MNLIEALRLEKPLRRPVPKHLGSGGNGWLGRDFLIYCILCNESNLGVHLVNEDDLLADDWEVENK